MAATLRNKRFAINASQQKMPARDISRNGVTRTACNAAMTTVTMQEAVNITQSVTCRKTFKGDGQNYKMISFWRIPTRKQIKTGGTIADKYLRSDQNYELTPVVCGSAVAMTASLKLTSQLQFICHRSQVSLRGLEMFTHHLAVNPEIQLCT